MSDHWLGCDKRVALKFKARTPASPLPHLPRQPAAPTAPTVPPRLTPLPPITRAAPARRGPQSGKLQKAEIERRQKLEEQPEEEVASEGGDGSAESEGGSDRGDGGEPEDLEEDLTESGTDESSNGEEEEDKKAKK